MISQIAYSKLLEWNGCKADIKIFTDADYCDDAITPCQTHSCNIAHTDCNHSYPDTDALITQTPGLRIGIRTADCVPVLIFAPDIRAVAAIHAGWKGTLGAIVSKTADILKKSGADLSLASAVIGPCICKLCYEVDDSLANSFIKAGFGQYVIDAPSTDPLNGEMNDCSRKHIDLAGINCRLLISEGLKPENICFTNICTRHNTDPYRLPSWRRDKGTDRRILTTIRLII